MEQQGETGLAFDIKQGWDLTEPKTQTFVDKQLEEAKPELLVCCPECKHWGGWYRLNRHKLPVVQQLHNQRQARAQADFCAQQIRRQLKRGGRVLLEHPWSSDLWKYPPIQKLIQSGQLKLQKANMCVYDLHDSESHQPILKPTGLAVSHEDMASLALECPGHDSHQPIAGHTSDGMNRSARAAEYTSLFVKTWLTCIRPQLCHFSCVQDPEMSDREPYVRDAMRFVLQPKPSRLNSWFVSFIITSVIPLLDHLPEFSRMPVHMMWLCRQLRP